METASLRAAPLLSEWQKKGDEVDRGSQEDLQKNLSSTLSSKL